MRTVPRSSPSELHRSRGRRRNARRPLAFVALSIAALVLVVSVVIEARRHADVAAGSVPVEMTTGPPSILPPPAPGTSRTAAWPIGTPATVEGWRVKVIGVTGDADAAIAQVGSADTDARPGYRWVAVSLHVARSGRGRRAPSLDMTWTYVARDGRGYGARRTGLPDDLLRVGNLRHASHANGTVAFQVPSSEVGGGVLSIGFSRLLRPDAITRYWALS